MRKLSIWLTAIFFLINSNTSFSQNCTVNAGIDQLICVNSPLSLTAAAAGSLSASPNYLWTIVSGSAATITNPNALTTTVSGINPGTYVFQFSALCLDGVTTIDSVTIRILPEPALPLAGVDQQTCVLGTLNISANVPPAGLTGQWVLAAGTAGVTIGVATNPATTASVTTGGLKQLIWRISNGTCTKDDTMAIRVLQPAIVNAGSDITASCSAYCVTLNGSDPGIAPQVGLWEYVSGPSTPTFTNPNLRNTTVCNLVPGVYTFRWTVNGPCRTGNDLVVVTVANTFSAPAVGAAINYTSFCEASATTSMVLKANGLNTGETGVWTLVSGSPTPVIVSPASSSTVVNGLSGTGSYQFRFTVNNANCTSNVLHTVAFQQPITSLSQPADQQITCNDSTATAAITFGGTTITTGLVRTGVLVSGPITAGVTATRSGTTPNDSWALTGMTVAGKYVFRFEYRNACGATFRDMNVYVSKPATASNAGSNILIPCNATSTALAGNSPAVGTGAWSQVSGPNTATFSSTVVQSPNISNLIDGTYVFRWTIGAGNTCAPSSNEVTVVKASTTVVSADAGLDIAACPGSFKLDGNYPGPTQTGRWTVAPAAGISFTNVADPKATVSGLAPNTVYNFTWTISNACSSSNDIVRVTSSTNALMPNANAGPDACLASGATVLNLNGNSTVNTTSLWSALDGGSVNNTTNAVTTATVTSNGSYRFAYALSVPGCSTLYDTVSYTIAGATSISNAGIDQSVCAATSPSAITLTATTPVVGTGRWDITAGNASAVIATADNNTTTVNNLLSGQYEFRYLISNGVCAVSEDRVLVTISPQPTVANAGADITQCALAATTLITLGGNAATSGTGAWTVVSGPQGTVPTFANATIATTTITGLTTGVYVLRWTISTGSACAKSFDEVTLTASRVADATGTTNAYCNVNSIQLIGNANSTGTWTYTAKPAVSPVPVITPVSPESANAENLVNGSYTFRYTIPLIGACASTFSARVVTNSAPPSVPDAGSDIFLCPGTSTTTLTGNVPASGTGAWSRVSGPNTPTAGASNPFANDTLLTNLVEGIYAYRYQISASGCTTFFDDMTIVKEKTANALPNQRFCNVTSATITGNTPVYAAASWSFISGPNTPAIQLPNSASTLVNGMEAGTYIFRWTINATGACPVTTSDVQIIIDAPVAASSAGPDLSLCYGAASPSLGGVPSGGTTYAWSPSTYLSDASSSQPTFTGTTYPGNYTYTLSTNNGSCAAFDQVTLVVQPSPADFTISKPSSYLFTAVNAGAGATYSWNFGAAATPATAATIGPHSVQYATSGTKTVSLAVTNGGGCTGTKIVNFDIASVLPLRLVSFTAAPEGDNVKLAWKTSDAVNVSHFLIESGVDGINFVNTGSVPFAASLGTYEFIDKNPPNRNATSYYRLVTVDIDGRIAYSEVARIRFTAGRSRLTASPNPFTSKISIGIKLQGNESGVVLKLYDMSGVEVASKEFKGLHDGYQTLTVIFSHLSKGSYILQSKTNSGRTNYAKIIKL